MLIYNLSCENEGEIERDYYISHDTQFTDEEFTALIDSVLEKYRDVWTEIVKKRTTEYYDNWNHKLNLEKQSKQVQYERTLIATARKTTYEMLFIEIFPLLIDVLVAEHGFKVLNTAASYSRGSFDPLNKYTI
jgi:hypothetical protein